MPAAPVATAQSKTVIPGGTVAFTTLTGTSGLATSGVGFDTSVTCLITPASVPDTCDVDGVVTVAGVGTYTLDKTTGVVTLVADPAATAGTKTALKYQVTDTFGQKATSTLTPVVPPAPTAVNDTSTGAYDTNQTITVLTNDAAGAGATLTPSSVKLCATTSTPTTSCTLDSLTVANEGTYTANANGTVTFDPLPSFKGTVTTPAKYVVADSTGQFANATITPTVTAPAAPVATPQGKSVNPGNTVAFTTLTGASGLATSTAGFNTSATCLIIPASNPAACDADGIVTITGQGTYTLDTATGIVTYAADLAATAGAKTAITYQVTDITGQKATSTLTPTVPPAPIANNDTSTGAYDTNQTISILTNDTPGSGATLVATSVKLCATTSTANASCDLSTLTVANEGTYTVNANGSVTFDPLPTFKGAASPVKYIVADTTGRTDDATITPTVTAPAAPVATAQSKTVIPGGTVAFTTLTGTSGLATSGVGFDTSVTCLITPASVPDTCDVDGVVVVAGVGTYTLDKTTGVVTLVADPAATAGTKTALKYQVTDITGQKATSTLTPVIPPAPVAVNDTSSGAYDTNQTITILTNDTATTPATIVATSVKLCATTATANALCDLTTLEVAGQGTYTVNANGTVTFDPLSSFTGVATAVKYVVADTNGRIDDATITPTVALPTPPVATAETKSVIPGGTVAFTTLTGTGGLATSGVGLNATVTCLFTPSTTTCDADGVVVVAGVGTYTLDKTTGVVTLVADPAAVAGTKAALTYQVTDTFGQKATSTLTPVIPAPPVANNDTSSGAYDTNQVISPFTNDTATTPATIVASSVKLCATTATANSSCDLTTLTVANQGTYTVNANGTVTFDPLPTFNGVATAIKYVIADTNGRIDDATITPTVALPPVPTATPQSKAVIPGGTVAFTTLTGSGGLASSPAGLNATVTCLFTPSTTTCDADGVVVVAGVGTYTLDKTTGVVTLVADPAATQGTKAALTYQVTDTFGQKATSTLTPVIPAAPVAVNDASSGAFDTNQVISPLVNDNVTSPAILEPTTLRLCITTSTANASCNLTTLTIANQGTYTVNANGTVTFDPLPNFTGPASPVKYVVTDSSGQVTNATITPTVALPNPPVATPESKAVIPGGTVAFTTLTGTGGLATAVAGFTNASTCLLTPSTTTCDPDGVVTVVGVGTYTLDTATGVVTLVADVAATEGTKAALSYRVTDTYGQTATSTLTPVIPSGPVGVNDTPTGAYDTNQVISPLSNDTVTPPATFIPSSLRLCLTTSTANSSCDLMSLVVPNEGTYTVNPDGTVTFDPLPTFKGTATPVKYVVTETSSQQTSATITPTVSAPNGPIATPQTKSVNPGDSVSFTTLTGASGLASAAAGLNAGATCLYSPNTTTCDADGIVVISGEGTYTLNSSTGVVTFAADPDATAGTKTVIRYEVQDITGQKATSTLTPIIPPPPVANNDTKSGAYDTNQVIPILTNDTAGSGATLVPTSVKLCPTTLILSLTSSCTLTTLTVPGEGTYSVNPDGTVTFDPLPTFKGTATPVNYVVSDTTGRVDNASITPTVAAPTAPVANPELKTVIPGATVAFTTLTGTNGLASSGIGLNATVTCLITPASSPEVCDADGVVVIQGEGTYTLNPSTGVVTFAADPVATPGNKTPITYQVQDITGQKMTSTLTPVLPAPPVGANDTSTGAYDVNQLISPLTNDSATSPATLVPASLKLCATTTTANASCTLTSLTVPNEGTYTVNANGTVTFNPLPTFAGVATPVKYVVADTTGQGTSATITPTVALPAAPVATPESKSVIPGGTVAFTTLTGTNGLASSGVGLNATVTCLITPGSVPAACDTDGVVTVTGVGTYTLNKATGVVTLVADLNATPGTKASLTYQVTDTFGQTATSTLTPVIPAPPVGTNDTSTGAYDVNQLILPLTNDSATSPATLVASSLKLCTDTTNVIALCTLTSLTVPNEGTYTVNQDGTVTFDPLPTFAGVATPVKYVVADSTGQFTSATITSTVTPPRVPIAVNDVSSGPYDANQLINLLLGDTPGEPGLPLLPSSIRICPLNATSPFTSTNCSLVPTQASPLVTADGSYWIDPTTGILTFDPLPTFSGTVTQPVRYIVKDAMNQTVSARHQATVTAPPIPTATPQTQLLLPGTTVSFTNVTGAAGLATGTSLQTSGVLATCLYSLNSTMCDADNSVTVTGEGTFVLDPLTGVVTFTADVNATVGTKTAITYQVTDILGRSATSTLTPIIPAATVVTLDTTLNGWDSNQTIRPLTNDTTAPGVTLIASTLKLCADGESALLGTCSLTTLTVPDEGTYTVNPDGTVTFDPLPTFTGTATSVDYQVTDSLGRTTGSTITPEVAVPGPPVATPEVKVLIPGATATFTNVIGTNALALGAALQSGPTNGPCLIDPTTNLCGVTVTIADEGTWTIDQTTGVVTFVSLSTIEVGTQTPVTYRVTDVLGTTVTSTLTPIIPEVPTVANDEKVSAWDTNQTFSPFANDSFDSNAPVVVSSLKLCGSGESLGSCTRTILSIDNEGTYTVNADGTVTFDPLPTFHGTATPVTYQAIDIAGQVLHATITPTVTAPPTPVATSDEISGKKGRSVVFSPWLNDLPGTAPEGFTGTIKLVPSSIRLCGLGQVAPNCTLTKLTTADGKYTVDTKTGKVTFVPRSGFSGLVTQPVTYQISNDWKGPSGVGISSAQLIANIGAGTLPTTGFDFGVVFVIGGLTVGAGVGLWRISTGRKRGKYHLPRWLNEVDGE
jgi:CshA-type fibril repeat protein